MEAKSTVIEIKSSSRLLNFFQLKNWARVQIPHSSMEGMFWSGLNSLFSIDIETVKKIYEKEPPLKN